MVVYIVILMINDKILLYNYCPQLPILNLQSPPQINQYQPLDPMQKWLTCSVKPLGKPTLFYLCVSLLISVWNWGLSRITEKTYVFGRLGKVDTSTSFSPINSYCVSWFNWLIIITFRYAYHPVFIFVVYNVIHKHKVALVYSLLVKSGM